jgi:DNA-binding transcriptional LysR family regulator
MIDIQKVETFIYAAESSSLSEAAKQLHLSQPAVSHQIKLLELELGVKLFIRSNLGLELTEAGHLLLPWARQLLHAMDDLKDMMASQQEMTAGELDIVCSTSIGKYILPRLASRFRLLYPGIKVRILTCKPDAVAIALLEGDAQLGIVSEEVKEKGLELQEFFRDMIDLVAPAHHPWTRKPVIDPSDIVREPLLIREETSGTRWAMLAALSKFDISLEDLNIFMEIGSAEGILEAVSAGHGISFVSSLVSRHLRELGQIATISTLGLNLHRTTYMVRKRISAPHRPRDVFWGFIHAPENADLLELPDRLLEHT